MLPKKKIASAMNVNSCKENVNPKSMTSLSNEVDKELFVNFLNNITNK